MNRKKIIEQFNKIRNNQSKSPNKAEVLLSLKSIKEPVVEFSVQEISFIPQTSPNHSIAVSSKQEEDPNQSWSFANADIRGFDFSNLDLTGFDFSNAMAGITSFYEALLVLLSTIVMLTFVFITEFVAQRTSLQFITKVTSDHADESIINSASGLYIFIMLVIPLLGSAFRIGLKKTIFSTLTVGFSGVCIAALYCLTLIIVSIIVEIPVGNNWTLFYSVFQRTITSGITGVVMMLSATAVSISFAVMSIIKSERKYRFFLIISYVVTIIISIAGFAEYHYISIIITSIFGAAAIWCASTIRTESLRSSKEYEAIRDISINIITFRGTKFENSKLNQASFFGASLKFTNFKQLTKNHENLIHTNWLNSKGLDYALLENTIIDNKVVRELLVNPLNSQNKIFKNCDLTGAYLSSANLSNMDFTDSDFTNALLDHANFKNSILTRVNLLGSVLLQADLTAARGVSTINTNNATKFGGIKGDYVYLLEDTDRYPLSQDLTLAQGELEKYLRKEFNTVDFSYPDGVNTQAFVDAISQYKIFDKDNENIEISIYSITNKGDGTIHIKVSIPANKDKENFYCKISLYYEERCQVLYDYYQSLYQEEKIKKDLLEKILCSKSSVEQIFNVYGPVESIIGMLNKNDYDNRLLSGSTSKENTLTYEEVTFFCEVLTNSPSPISRAFAAKSLGLFRSKDVALFSIET